MDNFYHDCPPMMSDGRNFTDYRTATRREEYVKMQNNIVRDDQYRLFLQQNANVIADNEWNYYRTHRSCWKNECVHVYPTRVYPAWMISERENYDSLFTTPRTQTFPCKTRPDYRLNK